MEGDDTPQPARLQAIIAELCGFLRALVAEETAEVTGGDELENRAMPIAMAVKPAAGDRAMEKRSAGDQHLMDVAHAAIHKALGMDGMTAKERGHMVQAREAMKAAVGLQPGPAEPETTPRDQTRDGSTSGDSTRRAGENGPADQHSTTDTGRNPEHPAPTTGGPDTTGRASDAVLDLIETALGKRSIGHQQLMDVAHHCVATLTDGATCESPPQARPTAERGGDGASKAMGLQPPDLTRGSRHSQETMDHLHMAHFHLRAAGAKCDAAEGGLLDEHQGTKFSAGTADLRKALVCQSEALSEALGMLDQLSRRVEDIAKQPLPPVMIAKGTVAVDKIADGIGTTPSVDQDIAKAWAAMTSDERTMALIKASYRNPYQPTSLANAAEIRSGETR
jgi:hypothetical protein